MATTTPTPTPTRIPTQARNATIVTRALNGEPRATIAADYGITTERVRQITNRAVIAEHGSLTAYRRRRAATTKATARAQRRHAHTQALAAIPTIAAANPRLSIPAIAAEAGAEVTAENVSAALGNTETLRRQAYLRPELGHKYDADSCIAAIQRVAAALNTTATGPAPVTIEAYNTHNTPTDPAVSTILKRFDSSWQTACAAAGVTSGAAPRPIYDRRFSDDDMSSAAADFFRQEGASATLADYEQWAGANHGRPAASTLRKHFGSWGKVRLAAAKALGPDWE